MDIASGISAVTQGLSIARALRSIEKTYDEATYKARIAEVIESLTDAKLALAEAKDQLAQKNVEIHRLKSDFKTRAELVTGRGDYKYFANNAGEPGGYPVCPRCETLDGRIVQLKQDGGMIHGRCPACSTKLSPITGYLSQREREQRAVEEKLQADHHANTMRDLAIKLA